MTDSGYHMIDIAGKVPTRRRALAAGKIRMSEEAYRMLKEKKLPKGDALALAEVAAVMAAKATPANIPLCHPIALTRVDVKCVLNDDECAVELRCLAEAEAKTGVEMEALSAVNAGLLAIYDLVKGVCPALVISDIKLHRKEGGKSGLWIHPELPEEEKMEASVETKHSCADELKSIRAAILTVSDSSYEGERQDQSGPLIEKFLVKHGAEIVCKKIVPDRADLIAHFLEKYSKAEPIDLIITTGGTGAGPRDITPDVVMKLSDKLLPGVGEELRRQGMKVTPSACLSRSLAAVAGKTLVLTLPGSPAAVKEGLSVVHDFLPHLVAIISGAGHDE